jgi:DNA-binding phage protein
MSLETTLWDVAEFLDSDEAILAYVEAMFEDGDPELIAAALNDVWRAKGLNRKVLTAGAGLGAVIATLKALGLELTAKSIVVAGQRR